MCNKDLKKVLAVVCTMLLLGSVACKSEPVKNDLAEPTQAGLTEQPESSEEGKKESGSERAEQNGQAQEQVGALQIGRAHV